MTTMLSNVLFQISCIVACVVMLSCEDVPVRSTSVTIASSSNNTGIESRKLVTSTLPAITTKEMFTSTEGAVPTIIPPYATTHLWNVTNPDVCILLQAGIRMKFRYVEELTGEVVDKDTDVPANAVAEGDCGSEVQTISLLFYDTWNLTFAFVLNSSDSEYRLARVSLSYNIRTNRYPFPNARSYSNSSAEKVDDDAHDFRTKSGTSSVCTSQVTLLNSSSTNMVGLLQVNLYDTRLEAFRANMTNTEFSAMGSRCSNDELSLLIPIIVGACLGGLIVIVIIAYIIGRQHSKKRYYMNV